MGVSHHVVHLHLAAGAYTTGALNTGIQVDGHRRVREVGPGLFSTQCPQRGAHSDVHAFGPLAEFPVLACRLVVSAGPACRGGIVPLVACVGHVGQQQLQHQLLAGQCPLALRMHGQTGCDAATATRCQRALTVNLHHTGAAVAVGTQSVFVAKMGNLNAVAPGSDEDAFARKRLDGGAVQFEREAAHLSLRSRAENTAAHNAPGSAPPAPGRRWRHPASRR